MLDEFLKNELSFNRESGTYLFYGDDLEKNYNIALEFSAELFSKNIENEIEKNKIIDVLAKVGGLDIAGMVGTYLGCAKNRVPVVIDGFISAISALVAYKICPNCRDFMIASHLSEEPGMKYIMKELDLEPMLFMLSLIHI